MESISEMATHEKDRLLRVLVSMDIYQTYNKPRSASHYDVALSKQYRDHFTEEGQVPHSIHRCIVLCPSTAFYPISVQRFTYASPFATPNTSLYVGTFNFRPPSPTTVWILAYSHMHVFPDSHDILRQQPMFVDCVPANPFQYRA
jgi:hypothetical protein